MKKFISTALLLSLILNLIILPGNFSAASTTSDVYVSYNFDAGNANDLGTAGIDGELVNTPVFVDGRRGGNDKAIQLDGTNYIKVSSDAFKPDGAFTISFWMNIPSTEAASGIGRRVISTGVYGSNTPGLVLGVSVNSTWTNIFSGIGAPAGDGIFRWGNAIGSAINDNTWHHVAAVVDAPNRTITTYYDGTQLDSYTYSVNESISNSNAFTAIGAYLNDIGAISDGFKGKLDDVMVIKKAFTETTILDLKNGAYDSKAPVHVCYTFNSGNAADEGIAGLNGELVNNPVFVVGRKGGNDQAIQIDGTNYIKVSSDAFKPDGAFTISFWMNIPSTVAASGSGTRVISTGVYGSNTPGLALGVSVNSTWTNIFSGIGAPAGDGIFRWGNAIGSAINDNTWHHVAAVVDAPNRTITTYYDGTQLDTYSYSVNESISNSNAFTAIGAYLNDQGAISDGFKGKLDDVMVIKKAFTEAEITDLKNGAYDTIISEPTDPNAVTASDVSSYYMFNGRNANDSGTAQFKGTLVGKPIFVDGRNGLGDKAIELDGSNYVKLDTDAFKPSGDFTISFWANMPSETPVYSNQRVLSTGIWGSDTPGFMVGFNNNNGGWSNVISGIGGAGASTFEWGTGTDSSLIDDTWHHVAGVYDFTNKIVKIYLDGTEKASYGITADNNINSTQEFTAIGGYLNNGSISESFIGKLDDVMVITKALSVDQITKLKEGTLVSIDENVGEPEDIYETDEGEYVKPNILSYYTFDDSDATDTGSAAFNGVLKNSPTFLPGRSGQGKSIMFNGTNSIEVDSKTFNPEGNFTVSFWSKVPSTFWTEYDNGLGWRNSRLVSTGVYNSSGPGVVLGLHQNQSGWTNMISGVGAIDSQANSDVWQWGNAAPAPLTDDTWHNIVGVFDVKEGHVQVYLDGVKHADYTYDITKYSTETLQATTLIGGHFGIPTGGTEASFQEGFIGQVDDLIVLDKALSLYEVGRLKMDLLFVDDTPRISPNYVKYTFNNDSADEVVDESGNNVNGIKVGNVSYVDGRKAGEKAISLSANDYVKLDAKAINPRGQSFSVVTWVKFSPNISNGIHRIISTGAYGDNSPGFMIGLNKDEFNGTGIATLRFGMGSSSGSSTIWETDTMPGSDILDNKWHCILVTFDLSSALATIYLDGFSVGGDKYINPAVNNAESAADMVALGGHLDNGVIQEPLEAQIDEFAIYDSVLGIEDIILFSTDADDTGNTENPDTSDSFPYFAITFVLSGLLSIVLLRRRIFSNNK